MDNLQKLISYSVIAISYDNNKDIFESFLPILYKIINSISDSKSYINAIEVKKLVEEQCGLKIPIISLKYLLKKAISQDMLIQEKHDNYKIVKEKYTDFEKNELEYSTEVSILVSAYIRFISNEKKVKKDFKVAKDEILNFYLNNSDDFIKMLKNQNDCFSKDFANFADFALKMKRENRSEFNCIKSLFIGSTIASLLQKEEVNKLLKQPNSTVDEVILDTNVLFGIYGFQTLIEKEMCEEILRILKDNNIKVSVIGDTINEFYSCFERILKNYDIVKHYRGIINSAQKDGGGMYSYIIRSGITKSNFLKMSNSIKEDLILKGINIIDGYKPIEIDDKQKEELIIVKSANGQSYSNNLNNRCEHDLKMIEYINKNRLEKSTKHSDAKLWALTFDEKLIGWNKKNRANVMGVEECISATRLINILWLNNIEIVSDVALTSLLLQLSNNQIVNDSQIINFINKLECLVKEEKIDEEKFNVLCNSDFFENKETYYNKDEVELFDRVTFMLEKEKNKRLINEKTDPIQNKIDILIKDIDDLDYKNNCIESKNALFKSSIDLRDKAYININRKVKTRFKVEVLLLSISIAILIFIYMYNWLNSNIYNQTLQILIPILSEVGILLMSKYIPFIRSKFKTLYNFIIKCISNNELAKFIKLVDINLDNINQEYNNNLELIRDNLFIIQEIQENINKYQIEIEEINSTETL